MPSRNVNRIFDNVDEGFGAVFDAARAGNDTTSRIYRFTIDEMQRTQLERTELVKRWADSPMDVGGLSRAVVETWQLRGRRRAGLVRAAFGEVIEAGREARTAAVAVVNAGESAARAGYNAGRETVEEASSEVRKGAERVVNQVEKAAEDGRAEVRAAVRQAGAARRDVITDLNSARAKRNGNTSKRSGTRKRSTSSTRKSSGQARRTAS